MGGFVRESLWVVMELSLNWSWKHLLRNLYEYSSSGVEMVLEQIGHLHIIKWISIGSTDSVVALSKGAFTVYY